jgi:septal ring factor EnvC (AmiA/AmiB activator)
MGFNFWPFKKRDDSVYDDLKGEVKQAFGSVKGDITKASEWISHLHTKSKHHETKFDLVDQRLSTIENDLEEIKNFISFFSARINGRVFKQLSKQEQTPVYKQTAVGAVQTGVQTAVQSGFLGNLSANERLIVWTLLNSDMKLSCEDIATILNKDRSTVRGQINAIKQKSDFLSETIENSGKKRFFVESSVKEMLLSKVSESKNQPGLKAKGKRIKNIESES